MPLEDVIRDILATGARGVVFVVGPAGSGKTTALRHLAAVLSPDMPVRLAEEWDVGGGDHYLLVRATSATSGVPHVRTYRLTAWGDDDLIEYLLGVHPGRCAEVMARLRPPDREFLRGVPELWTIVLDRLAADPHVSDARAALNRHLHELLAGTHLVEQARTACLNAVIAGNPKARIADLTGEATRVLRHPQVLSWLAAEGIAADLRGDAACDWLARRLPRELVRAAAVKIAGDDAALGRLRSLLAGPTLSHAMAASLLHAAAPGWRPAGDHVPVLAGAYLDGVAWAGVRLPTCMLREADLSDADLSRADLDSADATRAILRHARLMGAGLTGFQAFEGDLTGADLAAARAANACWDAAKLNAADLANADLSGGSFRETDCTGAVFAGANLVGATFADVELEDADFSGADLGGATLAKMCLRLATFRGARFAGADLSGSDLEAMDLAGLDFANAKLESALLTGAVLSGANLKGACLREAGLGDVELDGACLEGADLRGASFHMGSTRSGLLFTPIASEGTRTGFYTDDADEQTFKSPEEIRKANLCGADLRGALIDGVDFYLVDLRRARYDADQEQHFRRCRAILESRVDGTP